MMWVLKQLNLQNPPEFQVGFEFRYGSIPNVGGYMKFCLPCLKGGGQPNGGGGIR